MKYRFTLDGSAGYFPPDVPKVVVAASVKLTSLSSYGKDENTFPLARLPNP